ncbi:MAG: hypothetical protein ACREBQ_14665 [Nitrososphaerales archaeon]
MTASIGVPVDLKTRILLVLVILWGQTGVVVAQTSAVPGNSPKGAVEEFWKFETSGGRLTRGNMGTDGKFPDSFSYRCSENAPSVRGF